MSVRSKLTKTILPWLIDEVSIYIKLLSIEGKLVAPEEPVGLFVFVDFINICFLPILILSLNFITQFCNK